MYRELHPDQIPQPIETLAASCPGCGLSILFDPAEVTAWDDAALRDVMCARCGTVTPNRMLTLVAGERVDSARARRAA
jgi:hypothetical protein